MRAHGQGDVPIGVHINHEVAEFLGVATAELDQWGHAVELGQVVPQEGGRGQHVQVGAAHAVVPKVVHVPGEHRLHLGPTHQRQKPRTPRLVDVVVAAALVGLVHIRRIVQKHEHAPAGRIVQQRLQPALLPLFVGQARIEQQGIEGHEAELAVVKTEKVAPERLAVGLQVLVAHLIGRHPVDAFVAYVVVARHHMQRHLQRRGNVAEGRHRVGERGQRRHRVHDIAQVKDKARRRVHGCDVVEHVARSRIRQPVGRARRAGNVICLVDMCVGHHHKGK